MEAAPILTAFRAVLPFFNIFQDARRQQIITELYCQGELTVNELTARMDLSRPAVSHHLKLMLDAGVITVHQVGVERRYRPRLTPFIQRMQILMDNLNDLKQKEVQQ